MSVCCLNKYDCQFVVQTIVVSPHSWWIINNESCLRWPSSSVALQGYYYSSPDGSSFQMRQQDNPCSDQSAAFYSGSFLHLHNNFINLANLWWGKNPFVVVNVLYLFVFCYHCWYWCVVCVCIFIVLCLQVTN